MRPPSIDPPPVSSNSSLDRALEPPSRSDGVKDAYLKFGGGHLFLVVRKLCFIIIKINKVKIVAVYIYILYG